MPYIYPTLRPYFNLPLEILKSITKAGQLNYVLTQVCIAYLENKGKSYEELNTVIGALEACKLEFYRRMAAPYEDEKKARNGDVYS